MSKYVCTRMCQRGKGTNARLWRVGEVTEDDQMALASKDFFQRLRSTKPERVAEEVAEIVPEIAEQQNHRKPTLTREDLRHELPPLNDI